MRNKDLSLLRIVRSISKKIEELGLDALMLVDRASIYFFCGFYFEGAVLIIIRSGDPVLIIDSMNFDQAVEILKSGIVKIVNAERSKVPSIKEVLKNANVKILGYDPDTLKVSSYRILCRELSDVRMLTENRGKQVSSIIREVREIKSEQEVRIMSKAARETVDIWNEVSKKIKKGMTEIEIAFLVDAAVHLRGYKNSFETIAAAGPGSAFPHAISSRRKLKSNDHLLVDFGIVYKGYCSDLTRTLYKGRIDRQIGQFRDIVLDVQRKAIDMIAPGVRISEVLKEINQFFTKKNVSQYVLHGLGHGVGLEVHEAPFLRTDTKKTFEKGMVVTVEPGLYKIGLGGVRHEDMVLVTEKGCKVLTKW